MTELYIWWHESHPDVSLESITSSIVGPHMAHPAALTVSGVATQFGVWEYGHLANDYQLLFWGTSFRGVPRRTLSTDHHKRAVRHDLRSPSLMLTARDPYSCELQSFSPYKMA
jgi:hypothetical protein